MAEEQGRPLLRGLLIIVVILVLVELWPLLFARVIRETGREPSAGAAQPPAPTRTTPIARPSAAEREAEARQQQAFDEARAQVHQAQRALSEARNAESRHRSQYRSSPGFDEAYWQAEAERLAGDTRMAETGLSLAQGELEDFRCEDGSLSPHC